MSNWMNIRRQLTLYITLFSGFMLLMLMAVNLVSAQNYYLYVAAESEDEVYEIHFDGESESAFAADTIEVGRYLTETDGPHGMTVSPDGKHWFVSVAHGNPNGYLAKYTTGSNQLVERTELGLFPASMEISTATGLLYVVNFNLHGKHEPSSVMVVDPETMTVVKEIETGIMPHGSRLNKGGFLQYHASMMTDELIEIDALNMEVSRRISVNSERSHSNSDQGQKNANIVQASMTEGNSHHGSMPVAKPTWAHPHPTKPLVYVANNGSDEIVEVNTEKWEIERRFSTGKAPYNLEVTDNGKLLVASYKGEGATGVWDLEKGKELAKIKNSRMVSHGVTISPDSRYAFISVEGRQGEPGSVDVIDLEKLKMVDYVEVGKQAGGIYFWKMVD